MWTVLMVLWHPLHQSVLEGLLIYVTPGTGSRCIMSWAASLLYDLRISYLQEVEAAWHRPIWYRASLLFPQ